MGHLGEFDVLCEFKFLEAYETKARCKETNERVFATVLRFVNDKHVEIDLSIIDGKLSIHDPFAIDDNYKKID